MGICFDAVTAPDDVIASLLADPPLIWRLQSPDDDEFYLQQIGAGYKPGLIGRLLGRREIPIPDELPRFEYPVADRIEVDLDKSWDGINHCVGQLAPDAPLNLFDGGTPVGSVDVGYGPAIAFSSAEARQLWTTYSLLSREDVVAACREIDMEDAYPSALWDRDRDDRAEIEDYLGDHFTALKDFLRTAAERGLGFVVFYV